MKKIRTLRIILGLTILFCLSSMSLSKSEQSTNSNYLTTLQSTTPTQGGEFGSDIALSGNRLVVGEVYAQVDGMNEVGKAYLYDTDWNLIATLTPNTPKTGTRFGRSIDIEGNLVVVGSVSADVGNLPQAGEVQVYDSSGSPLYVLQSSQPIAKSRFGWELAIGDDIILMSHIQSAPNKGTIAIYDLEQNYLTTLTGESTLSIAGEELAASDEFILIGGTHVYGSVYVFDYYWNHVKTLQSPVSGAQATTQYGGCIAISGNYFVVGEPGATVDEYQSAGRAYVYDTEWNLVVTLQSPSPKADAEFGVGVSIAGDLVVVGEDKGDVTSGDEGKVYVFDLSGNLLDTIVSPDPETGSEFGCSVVTDGDLLVVSEVNATVGGLTGAGKIHVFQLGEYEQAVFELSNLVIEPVSVKVGEPVTVSVDVDNIGTKSGTYSVKMIIDGELVEEKTVTVDKSLSKKVTFTYQTAAEKSYSVEIGDLKGSFKAEKPVPVFLLIALVLGLVIAIILIKRLT